MKILIFLILLNSINIFSQMRKDYSLQLEEFINIVEPFYKKIKTTEDDIQLSKKELNTIMRKMYFAIADDPQGFDSYLGKRYESWNSDIKENKINKNKPSLNWIIGLFQRKIAELESPEFVRLLNIPYFLKIQITNKSSSIFKTKDGANRDQTILTGIVEDIIKGEKRFKIKDKITFMYLNHLIVLRRNQFEIGKSYFIPLRTFSRKSSSWTGLSVAFLDDRNISYLVEEGKINIPGDYFKLGNNLNWEEFKSKFNQRYLVLP